MKLDWKLATALIAYGLGKVDWFLKEEQSNVILEGREHAQHVAESETNSV